MADLTPEMLVLGHADHVAKVLGSGPLSSFDRALRPRIKTLIERFDELPFTAECSLASGDFRKEKCQSKRATGATIYIRGPIMFWCTRCDPRTAGASSEKLIFVREYREVLDYVEEHEDGRAKSYRDWIRRFARGKGMASRLSAATAAAFFEQAADDGE